MNELMLLQGFAENPRHKGRRKRAKKVRVSGRRYLMIGLKKRNPKRRHGRRRNAVVTVTNNKSSHIFRSTVMPKKHHARYRRRYRKNPAFSLGSIAGGLGGKIKNAAMGAISLAANNFLAGQLASLMKVDASNKELVQLGTAMFILPMTVKLPVVGQWIGSRADVPAAVALLNAGKKFLPAALQAQISGYDFPEIPPNIKGDEDETKQIGAGGSFVTPEGNVIPLLNGVGEGMMETPPAYW